jgi:predicted DNA-binding transcriptional regulator AlpA
MDRSTWYEFQNDPENGFPEPVVVGKTRNGRERLRWRKVEVLMFLANLPKKEKSKSESV